MAQIQALNRHLVEGVELVGYHMDHRRAFPGQWVPVRLYWKATGEPMAREDPQILIELVDENENEIFANTLWPVPSMPPAVWEANAIYVTQAAVGLPQTALPGELFLTVTPLLQAPKQTSAERLYLERMMTTGGIDEVKFKDAPLNRQATFASAVRLLGYQVSSNTVKPGDGFTVSLYWKVLESPPADYTVFIHLLDAKGELITQFDRPAGGNASPMSTWQVGQVLRDIYPLSVPPDAPAGSCTIRMGMYLWPSMERLPVSVDGRVLERDAIDLGVVQIRR
jgi:hypothetical protein